MPAKPARGGKWEPRFHSGVFVGMLNSSSEAVVVTEQGTAIKTRTANIRRIPQSERWDADIRALPWSPDGSDNALDIQVGMERPAEMVPRLPGDVLMENRVARTYLRRADFEQWGLSEGCSGCRYLRTGQGRQQAHSEACRRRIEGLLRGDSAGSTRLAATDERINRALADAVERHATRDPGVRSILKRASTVSRDATRETRGEPAQGVTQVSNGADVVMEGDSVGESSLEHSNPSGSDGRRRITTKREPREVRDEQPTVIEQHVPRRILGKSGEIDATRACRGRHHARGTRRVSGEDDENREC